MRYGSAFIKETNEKIRAAGKKPCPACSGSGKISGKPCGACKGAGAVDFNWMDLWEVEVTNADGTPGSMNDVPVEEVCRALDEASTWGGMPWDRKMQITKMAVMGKKVLVFYGDVQVGAGFILTKVDQTFDLFPELKDNPPALTRLIDVCISGIMGKSVPPQTSARPPAAGILGPGTSPRR
jgi:hypothetical protein